MNTAEQEAHRELGEQVGRFLMWFNRNGSPEDGFRLREECLKTREMAWKLGYVKWTVRWVRNKDKWVGQVEGRNQFLITQKRDRYVLYLPNAILTYGSLAGAKKTAKRYTSQHGYQPPVMLSLMLEGGPS